MNNPLDQEIPISNSEKIHVFAKQLAYGFEKGLWGGQFVVVREFGGSDWDSWDENGESSLQFLSYLKEKWNNNPPSTQMMVTLGYFDVLPSGPYQENYSLTSKALALITASDRTPSIFISYGHKDSSAFALLIEKCIQIEDKSLKVFIDKDIPLSAQWQAFLRDTLTSSPIFICLLTENTLASEPVRDEIQWALDTPECKIITIAHNGFMLNYPAETMTTLPINKEIISILKSKQALIVQPEKASSYEDIITRLVKELRRLGIIST